MKQIISILTLVFVLNYGVTAQTDPKTEALLSELAQSSIAIEMTNIKDEYYVFINIQGEVVNKVSKASIDQMTAFAPEKLLLKKCAFMFESLGMHFYLVDQQQLPKNSIAPL